MPEYANRRPTFRSVLENTADSILVYSRDGQLLRANRRARGQLELLTGSVPATVADLLERAGVVDGRGRPVTGRQVRAFLLGEIPVGQLLLGQERRRRIHLRCGPIHGRTGSVDAVVVAARDVSDLYAASAESAAALGALSAAQAAGQELFSPLGAIVLHAEELTGYADQSVSLAARRILAAADTATAALRRLERAAMRGDLRGDADGSGSNDKAPPSV